MSKNVIPKVKKNEVSIKEKNPIYIIKIKILSKLNEQYVKYNI